MAGISSGAALAAACRIAGRPEYYGRMIVTMVCDTGERYVHTPLMSS
jgi:cysteine synthase A